MNTVSEESTVPDGLVGSFTPSLAVVPLRQKLSDVLSDFARTMATEFPIQAILDHLVGRIVDMLPVDAAGVTLIVPGSSPAYLAASDDSALRFEQLQTELNEGPCLLAFTSGSAVSVPDLRTDHRFPDFAPRAVAAGLSAVFTFPLRHGEVQLGALDLYRRSTGGLSAEVMAAAQTLADIAAAYVISAQTRQELQLAWARTKAAAMHDGLTGLPNRESLLNQLGQAFARTRRSGLMTAVLFIDLDRLKSVNDSYGHAVGDQLLVAVAGRLTNSLRQGDTLARLSGDEFVVVCENLTDAAQAATIGNRLVLALARPYVLTDIEVQMSASVGLAYAEHGNHTPEQLLHEADTAMYQAKRGGGGRQHMFDTRLQHLSAPVASLEGDLLGAISRGELRNEYQPIVTTGVGQIVGFESLLRWSHPDRGEISPATLIPLAEQSDLINDIGHWVLQQAWADRGRWQKSTVQDLMVSVNISPHQIMSESFLEQVREVIGNEAARPELLTLEITESVFLRQSAHAVAALTDLRHLGVRLALDDFGTGYSSLAYLKRFPVDIVKIDRSFIFDLGLSQASDTVVRSIVTLGHDLGMTVVAEGVETQAQADLLTAMGCDFSQGHYYARPMPAIDVADTISRHSTSSPNLVLGHEVEAATH